MIDHPEDYAGPTEPCGDLSAAPFGGGEPARRCNNCTPERCAGPHHCRNEWDAQRSTREAATRFTGATPGMLQLSKALASKPDARQHAREAAAAITPRAGDGLLVPREGRTKPDNAAFLADKSPGSEWHLTMLMAPHHLNLVVGSDRRALLAWGRDVWQAACKQRPPGGWSDSGPVEGA